MLHKTTGILLHKIKYTDTSLILKVYTRDFGMQSYITQGTRSKKSQVKATIAQPLTLLDLVVYHKESRSVQRIKEMKPLQVFSSIPYDFKKRSVALFISEILYKSIREEEANHRLFDFIQEAILFLDNNDDCSSNFHLLFLVRFSRFLGFYPQGNYTEGVSYFNLTEGKFQNSKPDSSHYLEPEIAGKLNLLLGTIFAMLPRFPINQKQRKLLLRKLVEYYHIHVTSISEIKSARVLEEVVK